MFGRNMMAGNNGEDCWKSVTFSFKFYFISSFVMLLIALPFAINPFIDHPSLTVFRF